MMFLRMDFRTFVHATEDEGRVRAALDFVTGGADPEATPAEGHHGNPIVILGSRLEQGGPIDAFWRRMAEAEQVEPILDQSDQRLDEDLYLHLRLDKQEAFRGRLRVADHDDAIIVRAKVEAYPARREKALPALRDYLQGVMGPGPHP